MRKKKAHTFWVQRMQRLSTWYKGASSLSVEMASTTDLTSTICSPDFSILLQFWTKTNETLEVSSKKKNKYTKVAFWNTPKEPRLGPGLGFWSWPEFFSTRSDTHLPNPSPLNRDRSL